MFSVDGAASDERRQPLQETVPSAAGAAHGFLGAPFERPVRALILLLFLLVVAIDFLPFYVNLRGAFWQHLLDDADSFDTPIGFTAGVLACIFVLVAVAGGRAQKQALRSCQLLLHPDYSVHAVNILLLAGVVPWYVHRRATRTDVDASDQFSGWGYISGEATKYMMGLTLLPIARQSLWLNAAAAGYPEGIAFHRVTGWWCIAQVVIHTVAYTLEEAMEAMGDCAAWKQTSNHTGLDGPTVIGEFDGTTWHAAWRALQAFYWPWVTRLNLRTGEPEPNTEGVFILVGLIGTVAAVALAAFSLPHLRRARYDLFYWVHVPAAAFFIVMGAVHEFEMQVMVVPGLVTYFLDRTDFLNRTSSIRFQRMLARVRVMSADWIRLDLVGGLDGVASEAAYGTQFAYLRVPALGGEAHAFSLAARCPSFVIKRLGDWTEGLHQLAVTQATEALVATAAGSEEASNDDVTTEQLSSITTELVVEIDGVYGNASPPWRAFSNVLFVGGGVGLAPWLPAMEEHQELQRLHGSTVQTMQLVWIGRDHAELASMGPYLPARDTTVFLTRADASSDPLVPLEVSGETSAAPSSAGQRRTVTSVQDAVGKRAARPWLFAFVGVASLCLTQMSYYYLRGTSSVYEDYLEEGEPTQSQYFVTKALLVACSYAVIAGTTIFARWAARCVSSMKCPFGTSGAATVTSARNAPRMPQASSQQPTAASSVSVKFGRPDMATLIDDVLAEVKAVPAAVTSITAGLFVCVCGPEMLVQSCKDVVRDAKIRHKDVTLGLHAEEPNW